MCGREVVTQSVCTPAQGADILRQNCTYGLLLPGRDYAVQ
jgi:hypothetical protein